MNNNDFTIYQKKNKIYSMGFEFNNILKKNGYPAMVGGGYNNYTNIKRLAMPVGLFLLNNKNNNAVKKTKQFDGGFIHNDLYNKLLLMGEQRKTTKSKTRKNRKNKKKRKNKTKKH